MSDLVENPEDRFSYNEAQLVLIIAWTIAFTVDLIQGVTVTVTVTTLDGFSGQYFRIFEINFDRFCCSYI